MIDRLKNSVPFMATAAVYAVTAAAYIAVVAGFGFGMGIGWQLAVRLVGA